MQTASGTAPPRVCPRRRRGEVAQIAVRPREAGGDAEQERRVGARVQPREGVGAGEQRGSLPRRRDRHLRDVRPHQRGVVSGDAALLPYPVGSAPSRWLLRAPSRAAPMLAFDHVPGSRDRAWAAHAPWASLATALDPRWSGAAVVVARPASRWRRRPRRLEPGAGSE